MLAGLCSVRWCSFSGIGDYGALLIHRLDGRTVNARASSAEGLEFKSQTGKILRIVVNGSPPLQRVLQSYCLVAL